MVRRTAEMGNTMKAARIDANQRVVGVDLDTKRITFAYQDDAKWHTFEADPNYLKLVIDAIHYDCWQLGVRVAAVEKPYLGVNPATYGKLMAVFGIVVGALEMFGIKVIEVAPRTWQVAMLTVNGYTPKRRKEIKPASIFRAKAEGADVKNDHEADAVCIAVWAQANEKLRVIEKEG